MASNQNAALQKPRRQRPSKGRGLRTQTGCLTCRGRRIKCDEGRPRCRQCSKSERDCVFRTAIGLHPEPAFSPGRRVTATKNKNHQSVPEVNCNDGGRPSDTSRISNESAVASVTNLPDDNATCRYEQDANEALGDSADVGNGQTSMSDGDFALLQLPSSSPGTATLEWFDLLAQDAIRNIQKHNHSTSGWRWNFDERALSRKQSPISGAPGHATPMLASVQMSEIGNRDGEPWNTAHSIVLCEKELIYFQYYVNIVGPVLDLFDPIKHFTIMVPHLALHNVGLLKSLLAVAARHMTLHGIELPLDANPNVQTPGSSLGGLDTHEATQYYYETLTYLSHTMAYPSYTKSLEILATAIMIGAYEMFDGSNRDWERHLKGAFWIQRCQDNDGESGGLRTAVWWAWLRQDIWAAFRDRRKALTIWQPKKPLHSLTTDELATRILYILAKVIQYSSYEESNTADISTRIEQGNKLWTDLQDWYNILPASFRPISVTQDAADAFFETIWIHPPAHAAAIQSYHFAKIVLLLNQPHVGGINVYHSRQKRLDESVRIICGIAQSIQAEQLPSATVNAQALFAAGLCVQDPEKQKAFLRVFERSLEISKLPPKSIIDDLLKVWQEGTD